MPSRQTMGLLAAGLAATFVASSAGPALADHDLRQVSGSTFEHSIEQAATDAQAVRRLVLALAADPDPNAELAGLWVGAEQLIQDPGIASLLAAHHAILTMQGMLQNPPSDQLVGGTPVPRDTQAGQPADGGTRGAGDDHPSAAALGDRGDADQGRLKSPGRRSAARR